MWRVIRQNGIKGERGEGERREKGEERGEERESKKETFPCDATISLLLSLLSASPFPMAIKHIYKYLSNRRGDLLKGAERRSGEGEGEKEERGGDREKREKRAREESQCGCA